MNCNVVKDLIPLYIDDCCSEESSIIVREHLENCSECKAFLESITVPTEVVPMASVPKKLKRISHWKASVLQSVLLFVSFAMITFGVALEAATPFGPINGYWALSLIIPSTGFMLSLANWYFVRLYRSRKCFSNCSLAGTLAITACAYIWAGFHYEMTFLDIFSFFYGIGLVLTVVCCVLSKLLSNKFAELLGKE